MIGFQTRGAVRAIIRTLVPATPEAIVDVRARQFGQIVEFLGDGSDPEKVRVDLGALVARLLLFEECILESVRLVEIPSLVGAFGFDGVMTLLEDPHFALLCDALSTGQVGQTTGLKSTEARRGPLPLGSYYLANIADGDREVYLHLALQEVHKSKGITFRQKQKLKRAIVGRVIAYPAAAGSEGLKDFWTEVQAGLPGLKRAVELKLIKDGQLAAGAPPVKVEVIDLGNRGDLQVDSNLGSEFGFREQEAHNLIERALLGLASLDQRVQLMRAFQAVTGFNEDEFPLFEKKIGFLAQQLDPNAQEKRLRRVKSIAGLPTLDSLESGTRIDIEKLLKLRDSQECIELRAWLRRVDAETDNEIRERFESVRGHLASIVEPRVGRTIRFVTTNGVGLLPPPIGIVAGAAMSAGDEFLLHRLVGQPGPVTFLSKEYASLFRPNPIVE